MVSRIRWTHLPLISRNCIQFMKSIELRANGMSVSGSQISSKLMSTNVKRDNIDLESLPLMKFSPKQTPNLFYSLKNQFKIHLYLKSLIDPEFNIKNFLTGAVQAVSVISGNLSNDNTEGIKDMVTKEAYEEISQNFSKFTPKQKELLKVNVEDILFCFPYDFDVEREGSDSSLVKIFVVFHIIQDFQQIVRKKAINRDFGFIEFEKYLDIKHLCNYEFIRHYVKGSDSQWIVNRLNHFKEKDILRIVSKE